MYGWMWGGCVDVPTGPAPLLTGATLRQMRQRAGLTQSELARRLALSRQTINEYERQGIPLRNQRRILGDLRRALAEASYLLADAAAVKSAQRHGGRKEA